MHLSFLLKNSCTIEYYSEQKARATYEKLIDLCADDKEVVDVLRYLRQREVVHFQRFGEALRDVQDKMAEKKFYMNNIKCNNNMNTNMSNCCGNNNTSNMNNGCCNMRSDSSSEDCNC